MQNKLTITIEKRILNKGLEAEYKEMAKDKTREAKALEWSETTIGDATTKLDEIYENAASDLDNDLLKAQTENLPKEQW